ncbi:MAG: transposase [Woeseiaceae bacterium]|nr:transposase [Woeseiaceae bacterium]
MNASRAIPGKGTRLTRVGRFNEVNRVYHVNTATLNREPLFARLRFARCVVRAMMQEQQAGGSTTLAFVVMPDHLHWLVQVNSQRVLSESVCVVKSCAARQINALRGSLRRVWQRGFYDRAVRGEEDLVDIARYIIANPVRAGLVRSVRDFPNWDAIWLRS